MHWRSCAPAAIACVLYLAGNAAAQSAPDIRGLYLYSNDVGQISTATAKNLVSALSLGGMDGLALAIGWDTVEPGMGQFQWSLLDQWMGQALSAGRKVDLIVLSGDSTPAWVFQAAPAGAGAKPLNFTFSPHAGATGLCQSETIAAPWDPAYLARRDALLTAVSAHLKATGTYGALALLRVTGINRSTDELRLPAETAQSTGLSCVSDAIGTWQQAGYKPSLLLQAWDSLTSSFKKNFPDKAFSVAIIPSNAFPPIAEDGSVIKGTPPDANQPLLALAAQKFLSRLVVQFDFLMPGEAASPAVIQAAQTLGTMAAFQTNEYFGQTGQGAACSEPVTNPTPCNATTFLAMLETGIYPLGQSNNLRAQYVEVFHANATDFPDDLQQAHGMLVPPPTLMAGSLANGATYVAGGLVPGSWAQVKGTGLSNVSRIWTDSDFTGLGSKLPTSLGGVQVKVNNTPAAVYFIDPGQVSFQVPSGVSGTASVVVIANGLATNAVTAQAAATSPGIFPIALNGVNYAAGVFLDGKIVGDPAVNPAFRKAKPGDVIQLYATGLATAPSGVSPTAQLVSGVTVNVGSVAIPADYAGLVAVGEFQVNFALPANLTDGVYPVTITVGGTTSPAAINSNPPAAVVIPVQH